MNVIASIDGSGAVRMNVELIGTCTTLTQSAILDTGFNGDIVMPIETAVKIGLESGGVTSVMLADGYKKDFPIFLCEVNIGGMKQSAAVIVMGSEILLGMGLMDPFDVCFKKSTSEVRIEPQGSYIRFVEMMSRIVDV